MPRAEMIQVGMMSSDSERDRFALLIAEHATDSMVFTDAKGLTVWANQPFVTMTGFALEEILGRKPGAVLQGADTDPETVYRIRSALRDKANIHTEILNYAKDGTPYWIDLKISPVFDGDGMLTHFMSIERDISESKALMRRTEAALQQERERRRERKVLMQMSEWLFAAKSMPELQAVVTRAMAHLFPTATGELFIYSNSRDVLDLASSWGDARSDVHLHADECWALRRGRIYSFGTAEIAFPCAHVVSEQHPYFCLPVMADGDIIGLLHLSFPALDLAEETFEQTERALASFLDLAQMCAEQISLAAANVRLHTELRDKSVKDALTGLWNRRWFLEMAVQEIRRAQAKGTPLTLAMIDADHFKKFNDAHGHDAGDTVLKVLAAHLSDMEVPGCFPCRIGGEEFAVICSGVDAPRARDIMNALRSTVSEAQILYSGKVLPRVTISVGVAALEDGDDLQSLMKRADKALYSAKEAGRDRTVIAEVEQGLKVVPQR